MIGLETSTDSMAVRWARADEPDALIPGLLRLKPHCLRGSVDS